MKPIELKALIGHIETMAAAAEPGVVITEEISLSCSSILIAAAKELKAHLQDENSLRSLKSN